MKPAGEQVICPLACTRECRYLTVCLGGVRMPTWKQEPPGGRHLASVGWQTDFAGQ
jgi:hypothetical protein